MMLICKIQNAVIKLRNYHKCIINKRKIRSSDFTIISNNCWSGFVYQRYGLKYLTPTIGLLIFGPDYVKFCRNLDEYLQKKLEFISLRDAKYYDLIEDGWEYPVARLGDIEIYFMHYRSEKEAEEKWYRRAGRVNKNKILYKISEREGFSKKDIEDFLMDHPKDGIAFSYDDIPGCIVVKELHEYKGDEISMLEKYCNIDQLLNTMLEK